MDTNRLRAIAMLDQQQAVLSRNYSKLDADQLQAVYEILEQELEEMQPVISGAAIVDITTFVRVFMVQLSYVKLCELIVEGRDESE